MSVRTWDSASSEAKHPVFSVAVLISDKDGLRRRVFSWAQPALTCGEKLELTIRDTRLPRGPTRRLNIPLLSNRGFFEFTGQFGRVQ